MPNWDEVVQAGTDNPQVRSCLAFFIPAALKDFPQLVEESKVRRCLWLGRSNSCQYRIVDPLAIQSIVWYMSAHHLPTRKIPAKDGAGSEQEYTYLIDDHSQSVAVRFLCRSGIRGVEPLGIEEFRAHPRKTST